MVVTRRQSAAIPPPPTSRNNSSQGTGSSRVVSVSSSKGKAIERNNINDNNTLNPSSNHGSHLKHNNNRAGPSRSTANETISKAPVVGPRSVEDIRFEDGTTPSINAPSAEPPPSGKGAPSKAKAKPKSKKGPKTKKRHTEKSNKGISIFDILARLFLLWFTIYTVSVCPEDIQMRSPICRALTEYRRLILEPYILPPLHAALQNPVIASAVHRVEPVYTTAVKVTTPVVRRTRQEWRLRVMPQLVWLRIRARPYVRQLERKYDAVLGPYVNDVMLQYRFHVEPRVEKAYGTAEQKWLAARPYVRPIWKAAKRLPSAILHILLRLIVNAKTKWVDPQVTKIWASIVEQERASREGIPVVESVDVADISEAITSVGVTPVPIPATSSDDLAESETATEVSPLVPIPPTFDVTDEIAASIIAETLSPPLASSTEHIAEPTDSDHPDIDFPAVTDDAAASAASILQETLSPSVTDEGNAVNGGFVAAATPTMESDEDLDTILDEFLAEIHIEDTETESSTQPEPTVHEENPEEIEERLRLARLETARKRADLESRHSNWEEEIEKLGKSQRKDVKDTLTRLRDGVVSDAKDPAGFVRKQVVDIVNEAEKSLKGLKAFSKKLLAQDDKDNVERLDEWNEVVAKVDKKFGTKVDNAAQTIREWIGEHVQTELQEIGVFAEKITDLAAQAQQDLGMGYTWLADVTYNDWQRYHKLVETADSFVHNYRGLQNGTESDAPGDPLVKFMEGLQEEVEDIIMGFEASIGQIRSTVLDKLYLKNKEEQDDRDEGISADSDLAAAESTSSETTLALGSADKDEPLVSILPIDVEEDNDDRKIPSGIFMSRSPEEVRQAMDRAEAARAHEEL